MEAACDYYVLFPNHTQGLALEKILKDRGIPYTIVPTPRKLSSACGISIKIGMEEVEKVKSIISCFDIRVNGIYPLPKK